MSIELKVALLIFVAMLVGLYLKSKIRKKIRKTEVDNNCDVLNDMMGGDWYWDSSDFNSEYYVYKDYLTDREVRIKK